MHKHRRTVVLVVGLLAAGSWRSPAQEGAPPDKLAEGQRVQRAIHLVRKDPSVHRRVGLAEVLRAAGQRTESLRALTEAAKADPEDQARIRELICWRMMPVGRPKLPAFRRAVAAAEHGKAGAWPGVYRLYLASMERDRAALLAAAKALPSPPPLEAYPGRFAQKAHFDLLAELGLPRTKAGLAVITHRSFDPLYALRDLDRMLTREAQAARDAGRPADADALQAARDGLRKAYLSISKDLVERLFALKLAGKDEQRDELLARAKKLTWLTDRKALADALERLDEDQAWALMVQPMLAGDLRLIGSPPDLAKAKDSSAAVLSVRSDRKSTAGGIANYEGSVRIRLKHLAIQCDRASLLSGGDHADVVLVGSGRAIIRGIPAQEQITADRFTFNSQLGSFTLAGDVRIQGRAGTLRAERATIKLRACTVTATGKIRDAKSLLDDFSAAGTIDRKLALLPRITKIYRDGELPSEARYLLALDLLRRHLTWHAPPITRRDRRMRLPRRIEELRSRDDSEWRWENAHTGEPWMLQRLSDAEKQRLRQAEAVLKEAHGQKLKAVPFYWRLTEPDHPDIARARKLLAAVTGRPLQQKARRWLAEIGRNNTVLTFDIPGGYPQSSKGPVVMDARNAEKVSFKLYRGRSGRDLVGVADRIGEDFIYRDYDLWDGNRLARARLAEMVHSFTRLVEQRLSERRARAALPAFGKDNLVGEWAVRVAELPRAPIEQWVWRQRDWHDGWDQDDEGRYFDDACRRYRNRLRKSYRRRQSPTGAWVCDRLVWIPAESLAKAGAYVLMAEANGQRAYAPIVVEPLSLTMRRCRDGVFALVSDAEGDRPIEGARLFGREMVGPAVTDAEGAAFARIFAAGDRAVIAEKDGRYAIGGFGRVFESLYVSRNELARKARGLRKLREARRISISQAPQVYAGGHVVAAYTDRPTYRPGQQVHFKLIVRQLPRAESPRKRGAAKREFRAEDFEIGSNLELPPKGTTLRYDVLNPRRRVVAEGTLRLNDYGTAAGEIKLLSEAATGAYSLRVNIDGRTRVVPNVFAVKYYRRPNFLLEVAGVPDKILEPGPLPLSLTGKYYFGKPLAAGEVEARLVRPDHWRPAGEAKATLDSQGRAELTLQVPKGLESGEYVVVCTLTDPTNRIVSKSIRCRVELPGDRTARPGLAHLPLWVPWRKTLTVNTSAEKIVAKPRPRWEGDKALPGDSREFKARAGSVKISLPSYGWYRLHAGREHADVFVYGGTHGPDDIRDQREAVAKPKRVAEKDRPPQPQWVSLTQYHGEERPGDYPEDDYDRWDRRWDREELHLHALFEAHHAQVGGKLRVLVYVPFEKARLLLTIEGRTVVDYAVTRVAAKKRCYYHVLEIPIKERYRPNFYLRGRILRGRPEPGREEPMAMEELAAHVERLAEKAKGLEVDDGSEDPRWCRVDVVAPSTAAGGEKLKVTVDTDRREYRPGQAVNVTMRVADFAGRARQAEVSLGAVDESVYSFGEDSVAYLAGLFSDSRPQRRYLPKVWRSFLGAKWSAARAMERRALVQQLRALAQAQASLARITESAKMLRDLQQIAAFRRDRLAMRRPPALSAFGEMPAAGLSLARLRRDFRETAAWQPQLRTGPDGIIRTSFKLPDSLTAYRLTAVALTKETEIGTARAELRVRLPLSVQVFLPRFAVETDRLLAVALIHNNTDQPRTCEAFWEIAGATVQGPAKNPDAWQARPAAGATTVLGRATVPGGGTARVGLWITAKTVGTAKVTFRAGQGEDVDAEQRLLPIHPLGRHREVQMTGSFVGRKDIQLPAGFVARDLTVTLARSDAVQAMDGLGYLVGYPHGCVEQTMSRFLPAVMVKHAVQQAAVALPPDVDRKLPDVLAKGLARLYNFQHADGGWGWWQKDKTNNQMTVYVLYGLARCRLTGTQVDEDVLRRGCAYLKKQLRSGQLARESGRLTHGSRSLGGADLVARAWLVLVLADKADRDELASHARDALRGELGAGAGCNLALACHNAGLAELAGRFWRGVRGWQSDATALIALKLSAQVALGAPLAECKASVAKLLSKRRGHRWSSTRATSWAIEALADMLQYARAGTPGKAVRIDVAGKTLLDVKDPAELSKLVYRARADGNVLAGKEAVAVRLRVEGAEPVSFAVTAAGTQRLDKVEPVGTDVRIRRRYTTLAGKPIDRPVRTGEVFAARVTVELTRARRYFIIEDRRPAGCEFAEDRIFGRAAASAAHVEFRDDRVCVFHTDLAPGSHEIVYYLRAETAGTSHVLPGCAYPMYQEKIRGETGAAKVEVEP